MRGNKLAALKQGLKAPPPATSAPQTEVPANSPHYYKAPSREGRCHIAAVLPPAYKVSIRAVQMKHDKPLQHLVAEALNLLFEKYNVPTVAE
jgi:Antitoxin-like ribbon-helix-helix